MGRDQSLRRFADHHVAVAAAFLQPRCDVHRIADDLGFPLRDHLPGVHRNPQSSLANGEALLLGEGAKRFLHGDTGPHRANRIVLGDTRNAKYRLHAVAEKLRHRPAVTVHGRSRRVVIALHEATRRLGVESLVQSRRPDQIGEQNRDDLARARGLRRMGDVLRARHRRAALVAEPDVGWQLGAALRARARKRGAAPPAELGAGAILVTTGRADHRELLQGNRGRYAPGSMASTILRAAPRCPTAPEHLFPKPSLILRDYGAHSR